MLWLLYTLNKEFAKGQELKRKYGLSPLSALEKEVVVLSITRRTAI